MNSNHLTCSFSSWYQEYKLEGETKIELLRLEIIKTKTLGFRLRRTETAFNMARNKKEGPEHEFNEHIFFPLEDWQLCRVWLRIAEGHNGHPHPSSFDHDQHPAHCSAEEEHNNCCVMEHSPAGEGENAHQTSLSAAEEGLCCHSRGCCSWKETLQPLSLPQAHLLLHLREKGCHRSGFFLPLISLI